MTSLVAVTYLCSSFALGAPGTPQKSQRPQPLFTVGVQAAGNVSAKDIDLVAERLKGWWVNVKRLPKSSIPAKFRLQSGRTQAASWAAELAATMPKGVDRLLVVTSADLSDRREGKDDWKILGYSVKKGNVVLVSQSSFAKGFISGTSKMTRESATVRLSLHELARSFGVDDCHWNKCLMFPHRGSLKRVSDTDGRLCPRCNNTLWQVGVII